MCRHPDLPELDFVFTFPCIELSKFAEINTQLPGSVENQLKPWSLGRPAFGVIGRRRACPRNCRTIHHTRSSIFGSVSQCLFSSRWHLASVRKPCWINSQLATRSRCSDTQCLYQSAAAKANSIPTSITKTGDSRLLLEYQAEGYLMGRAAGDIMVAPDATRCRNPAEETMQIPCWLDAHQKQVVLLCQAQ